MITKPEHKKEKVYMKMTYVWNRTINTHERQSRSKPKEQKLSAFDDKDDLYSYIHRFEQYAIMKEWPEHTWGILLPLLLK